MGLLRDQGGYSATLAMVTKLAGQLHDAGKVGVGKRCPHSFECVRGKQCCIKTSSPVVDYGAYQITEGENPRMEAYLLVW